MESLLTVIYDSLIKIDWDWISDNG